MIGNCTNRSEVDSIYISTSEQLSQSYSGFRIPPVLIVNMCCRWKPFRRSAYVPEERPKPITYKDEELTDKKFFQSLIKPKVSK